MNLRVVAEPFSQISIVDVQPPADRSVEHDHHLIHPRQLWNDRFNRRQSNKPVALIAQVVAVDDDHINSERRLAHHIFRAPSRFVVVVLQLSDFSLPFDDDLSRTPFAKLSLALLMDQGAIAGIAG